MSEIDSYLEEKSLQKEKEELIAWRDYYLQGEITWDNLQIALIQRKQEETKVQIEIPIVNISAAIRVNYKVDKITQRLDRL